MAVSSIDNSRAHFAEIAGFSRSRTRALMAVTVVSTLYGTAMGAWAWVEAISSRDRVQRFVVYVDNQSQVIGMAGLNADWQPEDGAYLDLARRWVYNFRSRPKDVPTLEVQRAEVIRSTDRTLFEGLKASMGEADELVRTLAIKVDNIAVNMIRSEEQSAVVVASWDEQIMGGGNKAERWTATIRIVYAPVRVMRELKVNPLGLYVVEYQASREGA